MNREELIAELRQLDKTLRSDDLKQFLLARAPELFEEVIDLRGQNLAYIGIIENAALAKIAARLQNISPEIEKNINNLKKFTEALDDAVAIADTLATVVALAARIAIVAC